MKQKLASVVLGLLALGGTPAFATITVGLPADVGAGNCFPFGCSYPGEYQQVYSHSQFSGPISISGLSFFNTSRDDLATAMNSGNWVISLSTTAADWNSLSSSYAANIGGDNTQVFSGNLSQPWSFGDTLSITLSTPFVYNPANGNLLMDVFVTGATSPGGSIFFDTNGFNHSGFNGNSFLGRVFNPAGNINNGYGLVTGFEAAPVPEPGTLMLLGSGLVGLSRVRRKPRMR